MANIIVEDCFLWKRKRWSAHNCYPSSYLGHVTRLPTIQNDRRLDESVFPYNSNTHTVLPANSMIPLLAPRTIHRANTSRPPPIPTASPLLLIIVVGQSEQAASNRCQPARTTQMRGGCYILARQKYRKKEAFETISDGPFERRNIEIFTSLPPKIFGIGCRLVH